MYGFKTPAGQSARKNFTRKGAALAATPSDEGEDRARRAASGPVRGPGTGTSDDVQTTVPEGTYIMPADSTEEIGEQKLAGMGFKTGQGKPVPASGAGLGFKPAGDVPVNLSNGEFKLSPEQVHAIGVQVLEGLKAATHEPAEEAAEKYEQSSQVAGGDPARPDLFFADGGVVQDALGFAKAAFPGTAAAIQGAGQAIQDAYDKGGIGAAVGQGFRGSMVPAVGLFDDVATSASKVLDPAANALKTFVTGDSTPIGRDQKPAVSAPAASEPSANQSVAAVAPASPGNGKEPNAPANPAASSDKPAVPAPASAPSAPSVGIETSVPGIQRIDQPGQSPMFTNVGTGGAATAAPAPAPAGFTPGEGRSPDVMSILQRESQIRKEMAQDAAGPKPERQGWNGTNWEADERQRRRDFDNFSARSNLEGALYDARRSGRPQAIQAAAAALTNFNAQADDQWNKSQAQGFMAGDRAAAISRDQAHQDLARRALDSRQSQAEQEIDLRKREIAGRQDLAGQELGIKREEQGFQTRAQQRQEALQARYEAAKTPEERAIIAQQIRDLSGKELPNRFTVVPGGQEIDPATNQPVRRPDRVLNNQTGQFVDQPGASASIPAMPADKSQRKAGMTYTLADGRRVKWDGTGAVEVR